MSSPGPRLLASWNMIVGTQLQVPTPAHAAQIHADGTSSVSGWDDLYATLPLAKGSMSRLTQTSRCLVRILAVFGAFATPAILLLSSMASAGCFNNETWDVDAFAFNGAGGLYSCCYGNDGSTASGESSSGSVTLQVEVFFLNHSGGGHTGAAQIQVSGNGVYVTLHSGDLVTLIDGDSYQIHAINFYRETNGSTNAYYYSFSQWLTNAGNITNRSANPTTFTVQNSIGGVLTAVVQTATPPNDIVWPWAGYAASGHDITAAEGEIEYNTASATYTSGSNSPCGNTNKFSDWVGIGGRDWRAPTGTDWMWQAGILISIASSSAKPVASLFVESVDSNGGLAPYLESSQNLSGAIGPSGSIFVTIYYTQTDAYFEFVNATNDRVMWQNDWNSVYYQQQTFIYSPPDRTSAEWVSEVPACSASGSNVYPSPLGEGVVFANPSYTDGTYGNDTFLVPLMALTVSNGFINAPVCSGQGGNLYQNLVPSYIDSHNLKFSISTSSGCYS